MRILVLNQDWFVEEWRALGHEVISAGLYSNMDVKLPAPLLHIDNIIKTCPNGFEPDLIVYYDNSMPLIWTGFDETPIPTLFYSVDAHHHVELHKYLSCVFDHTLVAQKDYIQDFHAVGGIATWMPLWASRSYESSDEKRHKVVFVGTLDPKLNPKRVCLVEYLQRRVPLEVFRGEYWRYFPHAEIVLNQTVKGDLNFRVFEALMSGALLITEKTDNGLLELFKDGEHLVTYERDNPESAIERINYYLQRPKLAREIGLNGRAEVLRHHTIQARGKQVMAIMSNLAKRPSPNRFYSAMTNLVSTAHGVSQIDSLLSVKAYAEALKSGHNALGQGENMTDLFAGYAVAAALHFDGLVPGQAGDSFISQLSEAYEGQPTLTYARIRSLLNSGCQAEAAELARSISSEPVEKVFRAAEQAVTELLAKGDRP